MSQQKTLVVLDVGSSKIRTLIGIAEEKKSAINVVGVGIAESHGIRRGSVTDMEEAVSNITQCLEDAERMSGEPIHRAMVGVSGSHIETYNSKGVIAISGQNAEITEEDVERVLDAARAVSLPANREILRIIPKAFTVDGQANVKYPVGMTGIRLEVEAHIIAGHTSVIKNLEKCLYQAGVDVEEIIPTSLACAESVITKKQKELGVVIIEIGSSTTNIAVFEEGTVIYSSVIPIGGEHVTNDIAIGARVAVDTAERIKIEYGTCNQKDAPDREEIDLSQISKTDSHSVKKKLLCQIIEARYHEIFTIVREELVSIQRDGMLPAGAVLCGGAVKMPGALDLSREVLGLPAQIGFPQDIEGIVDRIDDPTFASAVGLLHFSARYSPKGNFIEFNFSGVIDTLTKWFKSLLP